LIPNITRGGNMGGLVSYLGGKGNRNEHVNARVITGSAGVQLRTGFAVRLIDSTAARRELAALLDAPHRETGRQAPIPVKDRKGNRVGTRDGHVWHCSLSMPADELLSDAGAAELARRFIQQMKLDSCEWAAIRHDGKQSNPHLHLVVNVVKPDGRLASTHRDYSRAQAACARITADAGLTELRGQQRHLPHIERTYWLLSRPLTGRYKRLHDKIEAAMQQASGPEQLAAQLKAHGVLWRQTKHDAQRRGISFAEAERPDVWLKGADVGWKESHLIAVAKNSMRPRLAQPELVTEHDPRPKWEKELEPHRPWSAGHASYESAGYDDGLDR
jgi:hypothetical protein